MGDISYIQKGTGLDLVFLHGYLACKETFAYQINFFSNFFKVTAFDFLGFGKSGGIETPYDVLDYANHTYKFLQELGIQKAHFIAHSFGGRVALKLCAKQPQLFDKLVLSGGAGLRPRFSLIKKIKIFKYKLIKNFISQKRRQKYGSSDYRQLCPIMKQSFIKIISEDLKKHLRQIHCQTLIICGENDRQTPPYMAKKMHRGIVNSKLFIMKNAGHFAFIDRPFEFNSLVNDFLKE